MKTKVLFVERKFTGFFSLEKVFRQIARYFAPYEFEADFQQADFRSDLMGLVRNLLLFRPSGRADIYHITGDITYMALVLPPKKTVVTIPDLSILNYRTGIRRFVLKTLFFDLPLRRSRYVTAISEATRNEIVRQLGARAEKVRVIGLPVDDTFSNPDKPGFNRECPNILQIGALPYKNLPNVIRAIEGLKCRLTIIGKLDDETVALLEKSKIDYHSESMLDDAAVKEHYRQADLVVFCSLFEGFGLPVVEAQAMRTPVVTSNIDPMKYVAGDGAILVDPGDPNAIRSAIETIIQDDAAREDLVERGERNAKRFQGEVIADEYASLYREMMSKMSS